MLQSIRLPVHFLIQSCSVDGDMCASPFQMHLIGDSIVNFKHFLAYTSEPDNKRTDTTKLLS